MKTLCLCAVLALLVTCNGKSDCEATVNVVQPSSNPPNYEVILRGDNFSSSAQVRFGQEIAATRAGQNGDIIARVPGGLRGPVEISVEENDCIARRNFTVLDSLPGTYGQSLPTIVLPSPPSAFPPSIGNAWANDADPNHSLGLFDDNQDGIFETFSNESHISNAALNSNPITGTYSFNTNQIQLAINRSAKGAGVENFTGQFIPPVAGAPANPNRYYMLLTSQTTGRQLVLRANF